jgi:hypothetical protein
MNILYHIEEKETRIKIKPYIPMAKVRGFTAKEGKNGPNPQRMGPEIKNYLTSKFSVKKMRSQFNFFLAFFIEM